MRRDALLATTIGFVLPWGLATVLATVLIQPDEPARILGPVLGALFALALPVYALAAWGARDAERHGLHGAPYAALLASSAGVAVLLHVYLRDLGDGIPADGYVRCECGGLHVETDPWCMRCGSDLAARAPGGGAGA